MQRSALMVPFLLASSLAFTAALAGSAEASEASPQPPRAPAAADPALASGGPVIRRNPTTIWNSTRTNGHSQINIAEPGRLAFMSGQVALPPNGGAMPHDLVTQARLVASNLAAELEDIKASPRDIVMLRMYVVNATNSRFEKAWAPIKQRLGGDLPGLTGIGVQALWTPEVQLEVEMIVRVPDQAKVR